MAVAYAKRSVHTGASLPLGLLLEAGGLVASGKSARSRELAQAYAKDLERLGDSPFVADPGPWESGER